MEKPQSLFGLVMAPTRELADQISKSIEALGSLINVRSCVIVGGMDMVSQAIALGKKPHSMSLAFQTVGCGVNLVRDNSRCRHTWSTTGPPRKYQRLFSPVAEVPRPR